MLHHTRGIVFNYIKYKETSIIVKVFTEEFGTQSYIINGVRSSRSKGKIALYQPLTLLDMVVYHKPEKDLQRISEAKNAMSYSSIPFDPLKSTIAIFLTEVLSKSLREETSNRPLFGFLYNAFKILDHLTDGTQNFHLQLLIKMTYYLGFAPQSYSNFNEHLEEKGFTSALTKEDYLALELLLNGSLDKSISLTNHQRRGLLDHILRYLKVHIDTLTEIKSLDILKEVLS